MAEDGFGGDVGHGGVLGAAVAGRFGKAYKLVAGGIHEGANAGRTWGRVEEGDGRSADCKGQVHDSCVGGDEAAGGFQEGCGFWEGEFSC